MQLILLLIASGVLGYEIVYSSLAKSVKQLLFFDKDYYLITAFQFPSIIFKWLGWKAYPMLPALLLIVLAAKLHQFFRTLFKCPYCTSFWVGGLCTFFLTGCPTAYAIAYGLCSMLACGFYHLIRLNVPR